MEIEKTSPLEKDADKLMRADFDFKFIVRMSRKELPSKFGEIFIVWPPKDFEMILRQVLRVPLTYPKAPIGVKEMIREETPQTLLEYLKTIGLEDLAPECEEMLFKLYVGGGSLPFKIGRWIPSLHKTEFEEILAIDKRILAILEGLDLIIEGPLGGTYETGKVFSLGLTERGMLLRREIAKLKIKERAEILKNIINQYNIKLIFTACVSFGAEIISWDMLPVENPYLDFLEKALGIWEYMDEDHKIILEKHSIPEPIQLFCCYLGNLPKIRDKILEFYKGLISINLAVNKRRFSSKGDLLGEVITTSEEVVEEILKHIKDKGLPDESLVKEMNIIGVLYNLWRTRSYLKVGGIDYLRFLAAHGISVDDLRKILLQLNKEKISSKYIDKPSERPFIIIDVDRFKEYIIKRCKEIEEISLKG